MKQKYNPYCEDIGDLNIFSPTNQTNYNEFYMIFYG